MTDPIVFDPHDPTFVSDGVPFEVLARIRTEQPVYRTPGGNWYLSRFADVEAALRDVDTYRAELGPITGIPAGVLSIPDDQHFLSEIPEPRHGMIRRLFNAVLANSRLKQIEPVITAECERLVVELATQDVADLQAGYAAAIPAFVMAELMGLDREAVAEFVRWSADGTLMTRPATPGVPEGGPDSYRYFGTRLAEQRAQPAPTSHVFGVLLGAEVEGRPLTDREIVTQLHFMIQAGVHTTRAFLVHLVNRLAQDDVLYDALVADHELVPRFCEESLRRDSPVQRTTRLCTRDSSIGGTPIAAGEWVEMGIGSANWDESIHGDPDSFRLDRPDPRAHLAFGAGSHLCPGAALARLEGAIAVRVLLDRVSRLHRIDGASYPPMPGSLGHQPVPVRLELR